MLRRFYTVMIVPHEGGALRRLSVSMNFVVSMAAIFLFCFVSSAFLAQFFLGGMHRVDADERRQAEVERLSNENARLRQDLTQTVSKVDAMADAFEQFRATDPQWSDKGSESMDGMGGGSGPADEPGAAGDRNLYVADGDLRVSTRGAWDKADYWVHQVEDRLCEITAPAPKVDPAPFGGGPIDGDWHIASTYGFRRDPFDGGRQFHEGLDMAAAFGSKVRAQWDGVVVEAHRHGGFGNMVLIDHGSGRQTLYGHLRKYVVQEGQKVKQGDLIGEVGSTGRSTGPHLHFEILQDGQPVDPLKIKGFAVAH